MLGVDNDWKKVEWTKKLLKQASTPVCSTTHSGGRAQRPDGHTGDRTDGGTGQTALAHLTVAMAPWIMRNDVFIMLETPGTVTATPLWQAQSCTDDWCFEYYADPASWRIADAFCTTTGGHLASIHSDPENTLVHRLCTHGCWLGLSDLAREGHWLWSDGTPVNYSNWNPGEPNGRPDDAADAAYMYPRDNAWAHAGRWDDEDSRVAKAFVCKRAAKSTPGPLTPLVPEPCANPWTVAASAAALTLAFIVFVAFGVILVVHRRRQLAAAASTVDGQPPDRAAHDALPSVSAASLAATECTTLL